MKRSAFKRGQPWKDRHEKVRKAKLLVPKALGTSLISKGPIRDRAHLARVAEHPCLVCGMKFVHAHHAREAYPRTTGVRVGDDKCVPLCVLHHAELHTVNNMTFWAKYHIDPVRWAADFYAETLALRGATHDH